MTEGAWLIVIFVACCAFIVLAIGAVAWSINSSIERERRREARERERVGG